MPSSFALVALVCPEETGVGIAVLEQVIDSLVTLGLRWVDTLAANAFLGFLTAFYKAHFDSFPLVYWGKIGSL